MHLYEIPMICVLVGLALYVVLGGADFGAGLWQLESFLLPGPQRAAAAARARRTASTPTTRWARCGRPTTSG